MNKIIYRRAVLEKVISLSSQLDFFEEPAGSQNIGSHVINGGLNNTSCGLGDSDKIIIRYTSSAEDVSVCKVLVSQITNGQLGQNNASPRGNNFFKFLIDDIPLSIDERLIILRFIYLYV